MKLSRFSIYSGKEGLCWMSKIPKSIEALLKSVTPKQRKTLQFIADGMNHKEAGIKAGYTETTAAVTVCRMLKNDNIQRLLRYFQNRDIEKLAMNRALKRGRLYVIAMTGGDTDALRAIDLDNKMTGENAPQKVNIQSNSEELLARVREHNSRKK